MANNKALTIDVKSNSQLGGSKDKWTPMGNTTVFIKDIITPKLNKNTNIGQLVSGIPTAFARVDLFKTALEHVATDDSDSTDNNMVGYYTRLADEWRGLIACMALDYAHITVRRIEMRYSDGKGIDKTANVYEPKGAFGNMLLRRKERWCDQDRRDNQDAVPYINVIKYRGQVVGATAPESLLFTSTGYTCEPSDERPWIDTVTGKFIDPLKSGMTEFQVATLHAYVNKLLSGIDGTEKYYENLRDGQEISYTSVRTLLKRWLDQLEHRAVSEGYDLGKGSTPPVSADFGVPFGDLFRHRDILYGKEGEITDVAKDNSIEFDPRNLLLDDSARIARLDLNLNNDEIKKLPVLVMVADVKGTRDKAYFALPLSAQGLNVFGKNIPALTGMSESVSAVKSTLRAVYDPTQRTGNLEVNLTLETAGGQRREFKKVYTSDGSIVNKDILLWPNFVSPQWDEYYLYNELPHNGTSQDYRAFPFVGEMVDGSFRIILDTKDDSLNPFLISENGKITDPEKKIVNAELVVENSDAVADNSYKYEIYRSDKPFKGVRLLSPTGNEGGYLIINYSSAQGSDLPHDWMLPGVGPSLEKVHLGFDFGSTNTSVAYSNNALGQRDFTFGNQRVSLMGNELPGKPRRPRENQVFFFPGAGTAVRSNAVKSILTLHDTRRLPALRAGQTIKNRGQEAVTGGFPSMADNLPFVNSTESKITLRYPNGVGEVTQIQNMKWEDTDDAKAQKGAFLRTLMLQVYAALYVDGKVPVSIKWSYPSAMSRQLLHSYNEIWDLLRDKSPVKDTEGNKYPLGVSRFVDNTPINPGDDESFDSGNPGGFDTGDFDSSSFDTGFETGPFGDTLADSFDTPAPVKPTVSAKKPKGRILENFMPDDKDTPVSYEPRPIFEAGDNGTDKPSLSEAEAVAIYVSTRYAKESNVLNLCFDIGGSTTDISALFMLKSKASELPRVTMIKQNSIRFAAQRVSRAVSYLPEFKRVLTDVCSSNHIRMVGLNAAADTYNPSTAPYFFDQVISRLDDSQLEGMYRKIAADCPKLMCVNLYVTGLLMFYAGELANKLVSDLQRTVAAENTSAGVKPRVRVTFAGKGSRLYQWLPTVNSPAAREYYHKMFVSGYGVDQLKATLAGWEAIELPKLNDPDIKFEVSKGLAKDDTELQKPGNRQTSEILGEAEFEVEGNDHVRRPLDFTNSITPGMFQAIGTRLVNPSGKSPKFTQFCALFYNYATHLFNVNLNRATFEQACRDMNVIGYAQNMPEYLEAQRKSRESDEAFGFVAPVIILEGMKFYENTLINLLK